MTRLVLLVTEKLSEQLRIERSGSGVGGGGNMTGFHFDFGGGGGLGSNGGGGFGGDTQGAACDDKAGGFEFMFEQISKFLHISIGIDLSSPHQNAPRSTQFHTRGFWR